jgi:hypothetical protein
MPRAPKPFDSIVVTALIMALRANGGTINAALHHMSALNGNRTFSSFEHSLRELNKLAIELNNKVAAGQTLGPVDMGEEAAPGTPKTPKTPKKRGGEFPHECFTSFLFLVE